NSFAPLNIVQFRRVCGCKRSRTAKAFDLAVSDHPQVLTVHIKGERARSRGSEVNIRSGTNFKEHWVNDGGLSRFGAAVRRQKSWRNGSVPFPPRSMTIHTDGSVPHRFENRYCSCPLLTLDAIVGELDLMCVGFVLPCRVGQIFGFQGHTQMSAAFVFQLWRNSRKIFEQCQSLLPLLERHVRLGEALLAKISDWRRQSFFRS